jgi:2-polyprenyl-6-methoxyphenol hydroxylase-like FAD-dependent oxidoreductase
MRVLIVGAGPSGLMMALCLKEHGVNATIIDKKSSTTAYSKALGMQPRTLEVFQDLKLADKIVESGMPMPAMFFYKGSKLLGNADFSWLETAFPFILGIPQSITESILEEALAAQGIHVKWGTSLEQLQEMEERVFVTLNKQGSIASELYDYVIGCDGIHSKVREDLGISFKGMKDPENFALADLEIEGPIKKDGIMAIIAEDNSGLVLFFPITQGRTRIVINNCLLDPKTQPTLEYFEKIVYERTRLPLKFKNLQWASMFNVQYKKAKRFSQGRCYLVGDAAHVHSPIGGQGMNTGLQDAYNLAWKIAYVIKHQASSSLLATYHEERHANALKLLRMTKIMTTVATAHSYLLRILRPHILKFVLKRKKFTRFLTKKLSQLSNHYRSSSLSRSLLTWKSRLYVFSKKPGIQAGDRAQDFVLVCKKHQELFLDLISGPSLSVVIFATHLKSIEKQLRQLDFLVNAKFPFLQVFVILKENGITDLVDFTGKICCCKTKDFEKYANVFPVMYVLRPDKYIGLKQESVDLKSLERYLNQTLGF